MGVVLLSRSKTVCVCVCVLVCFLCLVASCNLVGIETFVDRFDFIQRL